MEYFKKVSYSGAESTIKEMAEIARKYKVIHLADFNFDVPIETFYATLSEQIGKIHATDEDLESGQLTGNRWIDITYNPEIPDRYRSSNTRQPLHTDDSYIELNGEVALQFFYCASNARIGGATTFIDLPVLIDCMKTDGQENLLERLMTTDVIFSKGGNTKVRKIIDKDNQAYLANWNYFCIDRENNSAEIIALCEEFHHFLETRVVEAGIVQPVLLQKGEAVFFNDDRILHGRTAFFADFPGQRSLIKGKILL